MFPEGFISAERIECGVEISSKKRVLEKLASLLATTSETLTEEAVFDRLLERERLGSTGLGHGIALPHARMPEAERAYGAFIQIATPVDFDSIDRQPVDLAFAMLVPQEATEEHLQLLAGLAELFSDEALCTRLRKAGDAETVLKWFKVADNKAAAK